MSIIKIPIAEVEVGGSLQSFYYDNCVIRSDVSKITDDVWATATDNFDLSIGQVNSILLAGGEVYEHLMAVKAVIGIMDFAVPSTLPNYLKLDGSATFVAKNFSDWLVPGVEIWKKDDDTEVLFYTNPFAKNETNYLTGSEIKIINDISPANIDILTIANAEIETATGWTKL